jgi:hypothetical protein
LRNRRYYYLQYMRDIMRKIFRKTNAHKLRIGQHITLVSGCKGILIGWRIELNRSAGVRAWETASSKFETEPSGALLLTWRPVPVSSAALINSNWKEMHVYTIWLMITLASFALVWVGEVRNKTHGPYFYDNLCEVVSYQEYVCALRKVLQQVFNTRRNFIVVNNHSLSDGSLRCYFSEKYP